MRPASLALLLLVLAGGSVGLVAWRDATEESRAWDRLLALDGKSLFSVPPYPNADLMRLFDRFGGPIHENPQIYPPLHPWRIYRLSLDGTDERVLLIRWRPLSPLGADQYHIDLVAPGRGVLGSWGFHGAPKTCAVNVGLHRRPDGMPLVRISSRSSLGGIPHLHSYGLDGDELVLIRLEGDGGKLLQNNYGVGGQTVGPKPRLRTLEDCERSLRSGPVAVLAELTLLAGRHTGSSREGRARPPLDQPGIRARVLELRKSADPWIREAAEAVPLDGSR